MKKIIILFLFVIWVLVIPSTKASFEEKKDLQDTIVNELDYNKKDIIYEYVDSIEKTISDIVKVEGANGEIVIKISNLSFYKVINYSIIDTYYVADINYYTSINNNLVGIIIIPRNSNHNYSCNDVPKEKATIEVIYESNHNLFIDYYSLQDDTFLYIDDISILVDDIYDESDTSNMLLDILNFERHYMLSQLNANSLILNNNDLNDMFEEQNRSAYCNNAQTVHYNDYDDYTSKRGALDVFINDVDARNYYKLYRNNYTDYLQATDTMITYIIPKVLFSSIGIYSYIGISYGFFIKTVSTPNGYESDFIIILVNQKKKSYNSTGMIEIKPIFKGYAYYSNVSHCISQIYGGSKLVLANIQINISLSNKDHLNVCDAGYNSNNDYGYYIDSYMIHYNGRKSQLNNFDAKYLKYAASALSLIPKVGNYLKWTATGFLSLGENYYNNNIQTNPELMTDQNGYYNYQETYLNPCLTRGQMVNSYGNILKGINTSVVDNNYNINTDNPLLFDVNSSNMARIDYTFDIELDNGVAWDAFIESRVSFDVYEDNTTHILGIPTGSLILQDKVNNSWAEEYNEFRNSSTHSIFVDTPVEAEYSSDGYQAYTFSPITSGIYVVETYGTDHDTFLEVYMGNSLVTSDDDSGYYINSNNQSKCSRIQIPMMNGYTFTIKIRGNYGLNNETSGGYTYLIVKRWKADLEEQTTNSGFSYIEGYSVWQEFTASRSDCYDFFTVGYSNPVDTYIELYDLNHNLIAYSNSYDSTSHGKVSLYIEEGDTYFVKTKHMGSIYSEREFGVVVGKVEEIESSQSNMYYYTQNGIAKGSNDVIIYHFKPKYTTDYSFYTEYGSGERDVVMYLFDEDFNQIEYNDDGNGYLQPKITYNCKYWKTYYIMIKQYSASNGQWTNFYFYVEDIN